MSTASKTFYVGGPDPKGRDVQSIEADLEGVAGIFGLVGIPTFSDEILLLQAVKDSGVDLSTTNVRTYKITVEATEA